MGKPHGWNHGAFGGRDSVHSLSTCTVTDRPEGNQPPSAPAAPACHTVPTTYRSLAAEVGCRRAEVFKEIRRCLRLSGGVMHQGIKWIWKAAAELAELLGCNEKTIRADLAALVKLGWLKREKLQRAWGWQ